MTAPTVPILVALTGSALAAASDLRRFRVPNRLTYPLLASGLAFGLLAGGPTGLLWSAAGAALGFGLLLPVFLLGGMGGGDLKLLAALGAWLGPRMTYDTAIATALCGGAYALALIAVAGRSGEGPPRLLGLIRRGASRADVPVAEAVARPGRRGNLIPYAAMIFCGVIAAAARSLT